MVDFHSRGEIRKQQGGYPTSRVGVGGVGPIPHYYRPTFTFLALFVLTCRGCVGRIVLVLIQVSLYFINPFWFQFATGRERRVEILAVFFCA